MFDADADELCAHLQPVLAYLLGRSAHVAERYKDEPGLRLVVRLDDFFYRRDIYTNFDVPAFIQWEYAEPHFGEGHRLCCDVCRHAIESRFDPHDPARTLGPRDT